MAIRSEPTREAPSIPAAPFPAVFEQRVLSLEREEDWDGRDADAITADSCRAALEFTSRVLAVEPDLPLPYTAATVHGAVSLRWVNGDKDFAIYVYSPDRLAIYEEQPDGRYAVLPAEPEDAIRRLLAFEPEPR
jgi:hypothetical protein